MSQGLFRYSRPFGYHPEDVDKTILTYNHLLKKKDEKIETLEKEVEQAKAEVQRMLMEFSMLEVPTLSDIQEEHILEKFKKDNQERHPKNKVEEISEKLEEQKAEQETSAGVSDLEEINRLIDQKQTVTTVKRNKLDLL